MIFRVCFKESEDCASTTEPNDVSSLLSSCVTDLSANAEVESLIEVLHSSFIINLSYWLRSHLTTVN